MPRTCSRALQRFQISDGEQIAVGFWRRGLSFRRKSIRDRAPSDEQAPVEPIDDDRAEPPRLRRGSLAGALDRRFEEAEQTVQHDPRH